MLEPALKIWETMVLGRQLPGSAGKGHEVGRRGHGRRSQRLPGPAHSGLAGHTDDAIYSVK